MIVCPNCHHKELPGALFCSECGARLISLDYLTTQSIKKSNTDNLDQTLVENSKETGVSPDDIFSKSEMTSDLALY